MAREVKEGRAGQGVHSKKLDDLPYVTMTRKKEVFAVASVI